jgi:hypothetical protein
MVAFLSPAPDARSSSSSAVLVLVLGVVILLLTETEFPIFSTRKFLVFLDRLRLGVGNLPFRNGKKGSIATPKTIAKILKATFGPYLSITRGSKRGKIHPPVAVPA